ncbi:HNH endonuclease [Nostoc sp. LEGE 06077]|uniref:HNH endonuclease n=1 Tax=Nostoc sp. LEGE 06077 TaxID=915325 RepID=UPI00187ED28F|nr:HNH endonuclease signature motif containing protein [Nostoc sp. LEGE 06077]MBE9209993.1 HNH endonuclease [Nostoc sp. LEGE 06077]
MQKQILDIERKEAKNTCAIFHQKGNRFLFLYHRKNSPNLRIYFRAEPNSELHLPLNINLQKRTKINNAWEKNFPYFFELSPFDNLEEVSKFLLKEAYPLSLKSASSILKKEQPELSKQRQLVEAEGYFNAENIENARRRVNTSIVQRQGQAEFRRKLLEAYNCQCPITGCNAEPALEAAHIIPYKGTETNHIANGLPLRADIHTLFDLHLLSIEPETHKIVLSPELLATSYIEYMGQSASLPKQKITQPDPVALAKHYELFLQKCSQNNL